MHVKGCTTLLIQSRVQKCRDTFVDAENTGLIERRVA